MRINWTVVWFIVLFALVMFLFGFSKQRNNARSLSKIIVEFTDETPPFITLKSVNKLLIQNFDTVVSIPKEALILREIEQRLLKNEMIQDAEVYITVHGILGAKIKQRNPIARVSAVTDYYLDDEGKKMPLSSVYTARVPIVTGAVDTHAGALTDLLLKINQDEMMKSSVVGLDVSEDGTLQMRIRKQDFIVLFGTSENAKKKFQNYKAFYQRIKQDSMLLDYKTVDLRFGSQVVATKK
ncbi:MAG: cell division protein FtsQ [Patiriisocius sp.]|jgi:cell division protein FtsQ